MDVLSISILSIAATSLDHFDERVISQHPRGDPEIANCKLRHRRCNGDTMFAVIPSLPESVKLTYVHYARNRRAELDEFRGRRETFPRVDENSRDAQRDVQRLHKHTVDESLNASLRVGAYRREIKFLYFCIYMSDIISYFLFRFYVGCKFKYKFKQLLNILDILYDRFVN